MNLQIIIKKKQARLYDFNKKKRKKTQNNPQVLFDFEKNSKNLEPKAILNQTTLGSFRV